MSWSPASVEARHGLVLARRVAGPPGVDTFVGENRWYAIRIHGTMRPQIKHIALYQAAPKSAITHIAPVKSSEPWKDSGKFVVNFAAPAVWRPGKPTPRPTGSVSRQSSY